MGPCLVVLELGVQELRAAEEILIGCRKSSRFEDRKRFRGVAQRKFGFCICNDEERGWIKRSISGGTNSVSLLEAFCQSLHFVALQPSRSTYDVPQAIGPF